MAEWTNANGAVLMYVLKYSYPLHGQPIRDTLSVTAVVLSPEAAGAFQSQAAALEEAVNEKLENEQQASRIQEEREAAALRQGATSLGRLRLRLLVDTAATFEPTGVLPSSFDKQVPPLELDVVHAAVESDDGSTVIRVVLSEASARELHRFSSAHGERVAAVIVDEEVVATPFIASPVADIMMIHGAFTQTRAREIVDRIMN